VLTKSIGSHNAHNVVKATIAALEQLSDKAAIADMRGLPIERL
jgi:small subunit ribosomal protein S5